MNRTYHRMITALFCIFFGGIALVSLLLPKQTFSPQENRNLAGTPDFSWQRIMDGRFMDESEEYISDHIALRDEWVALRAWCERLSGKRENNGIYFAADVTLIPRVDEPDKTKLEKNISYLNALCDHTEIPVSFGLIPTAASVWRSKLPTGAPSADEDLWIRDLYTQTTAQTVDIGSALFAHEEDAIYYRTDHHWTSLGAFYGANAVLEALGYSPLILDDYEKTTVSESFYGTSWSSAGARWVRADSIDTYVPSDGISVVSNFTGTPVEGSLYVPDYLTQKNQYAFFLGGNQPLCIVKSHSEGEKLLLIRDSYSDSLAPFLSQRFSEIHLFDPRYNLTSIQGYIEENSIDRVLVLYSFSNFASEKSLFLLAR